MLFAYQSSDANNTFLFGLDINLTGIPSLSALPMVGALLPSEQRIALKTCACWWPRASSNRIC